MKTRLSIAVMLCFCTAFALAEQIPPGYYNEAQGLSDSLLKAALHDTIRGGVRVSYGTQGYTYPEGIYYTATWNYFPLTDGRADGTVWDMYSNTVRYFPYDGGSACGLQIEHCVPKSWWGWTSSSSGKTDSIGYRAYRDLYHLSPADGHANGNKSNYPPGHVLKGDKFDNGSFRMDSKNVSEYGWICFEPAEEYRGDFARAYFYIATAYQDLTWKSDYADYLTNTSYLVYRPWLVEVLLDWHRADPVSIKEIERADAVSDVQHNRNPFVDYPELVEYIWGDKKGQAVDFAQLTCTASPDYVPAPDLDNLRAYAPTDVSEEGFTARWSDHRTDYLLDVYTLSYIGHDDTIVNLPAVTTKGMDTTRYMAYEGKFSSTGAGTNALTMGSGSTDGSVLIQGLQLQQAATLVLRASLFQTASEGELQIFLDDAATPYETILLPETRDETYYRLPIPSGTESIRITSVGGSTKKRACLQELYLIAGDLIVEENSLPGYPCEVESPATPARTCSLYIPLTGEIGETEETTLYYRVSTERSVSNEVKVVLSSKPTATPEVSLPPYPTPQKVIRDGQVYILHNGRYYTLQGQAVSR